ncbi:MAG: hypothetical protein NZZ41_07480 [Candidatus Dojkabacteria bacterium]|nr:hypothetical protein [Candidatus Dojkabacteria bacterium]
MTGTLAPFTSVSYSSIIAPVSDEYIDEATLRYSSLLLVHCGTFALIAGTHILSCSIACNVSSLSL